MTAEFTASIGIDRPREGHSGSCAIEDAAGGKLEILNLPLGLQQIALSSHFRDADEHILCSPFLRLMSSGLGFLASWLAPHQSPAFDPRNSVCLSGTMPFRAVDGADPITSSR